MLTRIRQPLPEILLTVLVFSLAVSGFRWATKDDFYRDFGSFWASGNAANEGLNPYGIYDYTFRVGSASGPAAPNLNPPASVLPVRLLAELDIQTAFSLWRYGSLLVYAAIVLLIVRTLRPRRTLLFAAWSLALAGFWHTIELGQVYVLLLLFATGAWLALARGQPLLAGLCMGLLAVVKPNFLAWPLLLALKGDRRSGLSGLGVFAIVSALPLLLPGPFIYREWLHVTPSLSQAAAGMAQIGGNSSLLALGGRFGVAPLGLLLSAAAGLVVALVAYRQLATREELNGLALATALLLGPVTWVGYSIVLLPVFATMRWRHLTVLAAAGLCLPYSLVLETGDVYTLPRMLAESAYGASLLLVYASLLILLLPRLRAALAGKISSEEAGEPVTQLQDAAA